MTDGVKKEDDIDDGPGGPKIITWRLDDDDRALLHRVRALTGIQGNTDLLRFALGAAVREVSRAGGGGS